MAPSILPEAGRTTNGASSAPHGQAIAKALTATVGLLELSQVQMGRLAPYAWTASALAP